MERGVVVGGLMICGSFLLAASLNRSAVKEVPVDEPPAAQAPITPPAPVEQTADDAPETTDCVTNAKDLAAPTTPSGPEQGELRGNGREACSQ